LKKAEKAEKAEKSGKSGKSGKTYSSLFFRKQQPSNPLQK